MSGDDRPVDPAAPPDTDSPSASDKAAPSASDKAAPSASDEHTPSASDAARAAAARRACLERVFGSVLPDTTADERGYEARSEGDRDDWTRRQRPPHHL